MDDVIELFDQNRGNGQVDGLVLASLVEGPGSKLSKTSGAVNPRDLWKQNPKPTSWDNI